MRLSALDWVPDSTSHAGDPSALCKPRPAHTVTQETMYVGFNDMLLLKRRRVGISLLRKDMDKIFKRKNTKAKNAGKLVNLIIN